jgi:ATP-dependent DNA ligase
MSYFATVASSGLKGIVSKRLGSPYRSGRSRHWIKSKNPKHLAVKREAEEDWGKLTRTHSLPRTCWREK